MASPGASSHPPLLLPHTGLYQEEEKLHTFAKKNMEPPPCFLPAQKGEEGGGIWKEGSTKHGVATATLSAHAPATAALPLTLLSSLGEEERQHSIPSTRISYDILSTLLGLEEGIYLMCPREGQEESCTHFSPLPLLLSPALWAPTCLSTTSPATHTTPGRRAVAVSGMAVSAQRRLKQHASVVGEGGSAALRTLLRLRFAHCTSLLAQKPCPHHLPHTATTSTPHHHHTLPSQDHGDSAMAKLDTLHTHLHTHCPFLHTQDAK